MLARTPRLTSPRPLAPRTGPEFGDPAKENEPLFSKVARSFAQEQNVDKQQRTALFDRGNPKRYLNKTTKVDTLADCATDQEVRLLLASCSRCAIAESAC